MSTEEELIARADQLESIGFKKIIDITGYVFVKGNVRIIPTLIMIMRANEWDKFIEENSGECPYFEKEGRCIPGCGTDTCIHHPINR